MSIKFETEEFYGCKPNKEQPNKKSEYFILDFVTKQKSLALLH
jgi:hypothetical protein